MSNGKQQLLLFICSKRGSTLQKILSYNLSQSPQSTCHYTCVRIVITHVFRISIDFSLVKKFPVRRETEQKLHPEKKSVFRKKSQYGTKT